MPQALPPLRASERVEIASIMMMSTQEKVKLLIEKKRQTLNILQKENHEKQTSAIQKIRQLQENELQCIMDSGTYVQCCDCHKWRLVREIEDPSLVPEYWVCSMNMDEAANDCGKGDGEHVESDEELIGVEYTCGSLVWIKFKGNKLVVSQ